MDPLTHTLTGLAMSRAGLNRWCPKATPVLLLAANAPDIDVVSAAGGAAVYLHYHRHITHAFLLVPLLAVLPVLLVRLFSRKELNWRGAYAVSFLGALSHPLLDWTNNYGVRAFLPFSERWIRLDITNVIDLWIWAALLAAALVPALSRLVSVEIGAKPGPGRGAAVLALLFVLAYESGRFVLHQRAVAVLEARLHDGREPLRAAALPGPANPLRWRGLVETETSYVLHELDLSGEFDPDGGRVLYKARPDAVQEAARRAASRTDAFRAFLKFSQFPLWRFTPADDPEGATRVEAMDLRFGAPPEARFIATAVVTADGRIVRSWFQF